MNDDADFYLRSLADLEAERDAGDLDPEAYRELHDRYTALAAAALRHDTGVLGGSSAEYEAERTQNGVAARPAWVRAVAFVIVASLLAGGAGLAVAAAVGERAPGEQVSGGIESSTPDLLARARVLAGQGQALEAIKAYDKVIAADPRNVEALAYRGWLLRLASLPDEGLRYVERAIAVDPDYPDAHFFRGVILLEDRKDAAGAIPELERYLASGPPEALAASVRAVLDRARDEVASGIRR
ncbi:MAG TPA: tetratricopeptide repeat protein [Acidimicrobiales bacterium]|nr:tetratricopeptide repeat protein [Acidimicrobiales bacterium]